MTQSLRRAQQCATAPTRQARRKTHAETRVDVDEVAAVDYAWSRHSHVIEALRNEVAIGQVVAGKFRIDAILGQGGMGVVVAAHHLVLDEPVALKFLLPDGPASGEAVIRFEREARAAAKIRSEHVTRVTDVGRLQSGTPYLVMELLRGRDLGEVLSERGCLPLAEVADYVLQAGEAIAEAHSLGIVHRDLKPSNLFLTQRADGSSCVKVLDFGISKWTGAGSGADPGLTRTAALMGSPLYMSPEQLLSSRDVDQRTDIWSLGVICYQLLAGNPPFEAETLPQLCMTIAHAEPSPLRGLRPDLSSEIEELVRRCLQKDPRQRLGSVAELARQLVKFAPKHSQLSAERIERLAGSSGQAKDEARAAVPLDADVKPLADRDDSSSVSVFARTKAANTATRTRAVAIGAALFVAGGAALFVFAPRSSSSLAPAASLSVAAASPVNAGSINPEHPATSPLPTQTQLAGSDPGASAANASANSAASAGLPSELPSATPSALPSAVLPPAPNRAKQTGRPTEHVKPTPRATLSPKPPAKPADPQPKPARGELGGRL